MSVTLKKSKCAYYAHIICPILSLVGLVTFIAGVHEIVDMANARDDRLIYRYRRYGHQDASDIPTTFRPVVGQLPVNHTMYNHEEQDALLSFGNSKHCEVGCETGVPCDYETETDFRIIVLAYNNVEKLAQCLKHVQKIDMGGDDMVINVWVDREIGGDWNEGILKEATHLLESWQDGMVCVHLQDYHAGDKTQWINAWKPQQNSTEIALIIEEDVLVSPFIYKWLKPIWKKYLVNDKYKLSGVSPGWENLRYDTATGTKKIKGPRTDGVYAYRAISSGAFVPQPSHWEAFQRWYANTQVLHRLTKFHIPGFFPENWHQEDESKHFSWEMWFIYYCYNHDLYSLYPNLEEYAQVAKTALLYHGGHAGMTGIIRESEAQDLLMDEWKDQFGTLPALLTYVDFDGKPKWRM